jgi:four helix bundle protein
MKHDNLRDRTKQLALDIIRVAQALPKDTVTHILVRQLLRAGTSVGANYRAACRAKSRVDFIAKMGIVLEETDEVLYWIELLIGAGIVTDVKVKGINNEANELLAITIASIKTAKQNAGQY